VVPIAPSSTFRPIPHETAFRWVSERFRIDKPFVLTVGDLQPRKNQIGLIQAFEELILRNPQLPHRLVIVGKKTWFADRIVETGKNSRIADRIVYTGFVNDDELLQLYNACDMMVFPSFYEGFGLPILEAMACGRAVACSNTSSMPEVANAAAIVFDPASRDEIVRSMRDILLDAELRTRMERLGLHRASLFTWQRTAQQTLEIYRQVAGANILRPEHVTRVPVSPR
jgi:glycosyltransferase involved in cell wall biosynthesis